jgi:phage baseplate assembly protein V
MPSNENTCVLRFGYISVFDAEKKLARVRFPDKDDLVSWWLQVVVINTLENQDEINFDPGEHVACLMAGNGIERGVVLGALWDKKNEPPVGDQDIRVTKYKDGTTVQVDRKNHIVEVKDHYGSYIRFEGGNIHLIAAGNVHINNPQFDRCCGNCSC